MQQSSAVAKKTVKRRLDLEIAEGIEGPSNVHGALVPKALLEQREEELRVVKRKNRTLQKLNYELQRALCSKIFDKGECLILNILWKATQLLNLFFLVVFYSSEIFSNFSFHFERSLRYGFHFASVKRLILLRALTSTSRLAFSWE